MFMAIFKPLELKICTCFNILAKSLYMSYMGNSDFIRREGKQRVRIGCRHKKDVLDNKCAVSVEIFKTYEQWCTVCLRNPTFLGVYLNTCFCAVSVLLFFVQVAG